MNYARHPPKYAAIHHVGHGPWNCTVVMDLIWGAPVDWGVMFGEWEGMTPGTSIFCLPNFPP